MYLTLNTGKEKTMFKKLLAVVTVVFVFTGADFFATAVFLDVVDFFTSAFFDVDFAFVENNKINNYEYQIIKQVDMKDEGSDHRPIIITIN